MATVPAASERSDTLHNGAHGQAGVEPGPPPMTALNWGNSAPLALLAFGVTTFMLSMVNANAISKGVEPVVFGVALMFGGLTQLIAGVIQLRTGNTFAGVLFAGFGAFWMSLFAIVQWFLKDVPVAQVGHALGLFLYAFGIFVVVMLAASFRTNVVVVLALTILVFAFFFLGAGNYGGHTTLIHWGGYTGLAAAACAFYLALAELCEFSYGKTVLTVWPLAKHS
ncbi:MAG TPA: acetate uptake transporter [Solirubrobacteraceae bacterium]|nr:acetate uptake transporter [Solirubrobacteraceae bacterium]